MSYGFGTVNMGVQSSAVRGGSLVLNSVYALVHVLYVIWRIRREKGQPYSLNLEREKE